jgi:hypothetical protein
MKKNLQCNHKEDEYALPGDSIKICLEYGATLPNIAGQRDMINELVK